MGKFKVGDKVVPHDKSIYGPLSNSKTWERATHSGQNYLYIVQLDVYRIVASDASYSPTGDYFTESDLTLYQETSQSSLKVEDLVPGEVYYWDFKDYRYIAKCKDKAYIYERLSSQKKFAGAEESSKSNANLVLNKNLTIRKATPKEIEWLEQCVRANKYVDYVEPSTTTKITELPKKWCIKVTRDPINHPEIREWRNIDWSFEGYIHNNNSKEWDSGILKGYTEITTEQFKKWVLNEEIVSEVKTPKIGKWYQDSRWNTTQDYAKCTRFESESIYFDECIYEGMYWQKYDDWIASEATIREVPLSEIQKYLPDGHSDKLVVPLDQVKEEPTTILESKVDDIGNVTDKPETNLEKANRLYPPGTRIKCAYDGEIGVIGKLEEKPEGIIWNNGYYQYVYHKDTDTWAEILSIATEPLFKEGWYTLPNFPKLLYFVKDDLSGWGFNVSGEWTTFKDVLDFKDELVLEEEEDAMKVLLEYAALKYPEGTIYQGITLAGVVWKNHSEANYTPRLLGTGIDVGGDYIYHISTGKWAEIVRTVDAVEDIKEPTPSPNPWKPSVGDYITITKSKVNWCERSMDELVGKTYKVKCSDGDRIEFGEDKNKIWRSSQGHFRQATPEEILSITTPMQEPQQDVKTIEPKVENTLISVNCTTVEQWQEVISFYPDIAKRYSVEKLSKLPNGENTTLTISGEYKGGYVDIEFDNDTGYKIISFEEWEKSIGKTKTTPKNVVPLTKDMEKWLEKVKPLRLSLDALVKYINNTQTTPYSIYEVIPGKLSEGKAEYLLVEWAKESSTETTEDVFPKLGKIELELKEETELLKPVSINFNISNQLLII